MNRNFYELRYRLLETFYDVLYEENYEYGQAAARTYYEFHQEANSKGIESIIVYITIGKRLLKHKAVSEYHQKFIKDAIAVYESTDVKLALKEDENEVLCEEISDLKIELKI
jgi:cell division protein FtsB